jgi:hypothetical protein
MGSRTVGESEIGFEFDLSAIAGGEAYEVLVDVVELSASGGSTGTGGMGPAPGGSFGSTCQG